MTWTTRPRSRFGGLAAIVAGEGPPLLLIHGVGLRAEAWNAQIDGLQDRFSIVAPDLPGHGGSEAFQRQPDLTAYVDAVSALVDRPMVIAGHSMGAMIALSLAARLPDKVCGVAAFNAIYRRSPEARAAVQARADSLAGQAAADPTPALKRWFGSQDSPERAACDQWLRTVDPVAYKSAYSVFAETDGPTDDELAAITCPALFMTGAEEPNSTPEMSRAMAAKTAQGRAEIIPGAAHMLPMTHPQVATDALAALCQKALS